MYVSYVVKVYVGWVVFEIVCEVGVDVECVFVGEVECVFDVGFFGECVWYMVVNLLDVDFDYVVLCWELNFEMIVMVGVVDIIDCLCECGFDGWFCFWVNFGVGVGYYEKVMIGGYVKFGIFIDCVFDFVVDVCEEFDFVGVYVYVGSGIFGDDFLVYCELVCWMGDFVCEVGGFEFVDVGGGFGVFYCEDELLFDFVVVVDVICEVFGEVDV